jgi:hypothetical protein
VLSIVSAALAASLFGMMLLYPVPVWSVLAVLAAVALVAAWPALVRDSVPAVTTAATALALAVVLSWYDEWLTAATVTAALVLIGAAHLRSRRELVAALAGGAVPALLALLVATVGVLADAAPGWIGLVGLLLLSVLTVGRHQVPVGLRTAGVDAVLELSAACAAFVLAATALDSVPEVDGSTWLAIYLTLAGAAVSILALSRPDRRPAAWLGGLLLAAATWVRLADLGVQAPEPYTLPSAVALLVVGLLRLRRDRSAGTGESLSPGLMLALVPSLIWVLSEPGGLRSVILGLACLGLVVGGAQLRWMAPLAYGAVAGLVVVLVEAGPYVGDAVPRWALIGAAGAVLIALGVTWEQRLRDARLVSAYVHALR